ncbi:hypothetical protein [Aurantiacibacter rhizosphaerae]|uniref:DUF4440 domain-containing protein n=1 Tax=Aurantiacibacter rhizosphaerae TaxID=2691582 RepID=A0A844XGQ4_9SPHN|nr:hypothetical protein [Aurantiacibacter rhizosphaerae]MWV29206.1 hypothetical protein [Aurantiacibacter rhizosphaerae]
MTKLPRRIALIAALTLSGCGSPVEENPDQALPPVMATPGPSATAESASPDVSPAELTPEAERGEKGARNALISFARAIELRETDQAFGLLSPHAKETWSGGKFASLFEGLQDITVAVPGGQMEGAAGTSYYTSQATVTASDADGRPVRLEGPIVLSRVNDVPGSTAEQRRWSIRSIDLTQTH